MTTGPVTQRPFLVRSVAAQISTHLEIANALEAGQFVPWFQPLVALSTGRIEGFELLARWDHPYLGIISPDEFIPLAERDGWITRMMNVILQQALASMSVLPPLGLSINVSPVQLQDPELPQLIRNAARLAAFPLERLTIEITETAFAGNIAQARKMTEEFKSMGCRIALDDFGTGYSSLFHLQSLPFDEIKVDHSFVSSMTERRESRKIVAAVIGLGQSLDLKTVAEGVETHEQADLLLRLGCDVGQGLLYGTPAPAKMLAKMIAKPRKSAALPGSSVAPCFSVCSLQGLPAQRLAQLQAVYDGAPVGLGFIDRRLKYLNINHKLAAMHGATVEEHLGRTLPEMIPQVYPLIEPYVLRALSGESVNSVEITEPDFPGSRKRTFLVSYQPARDEAGEVVGISCAVMDFTDYRLTEEKLRNFGSAIESLDEMVVVVDRNYYCLLANRAFLERRGVATAQVLGRFMHEVVGADIFDQLIKPRLEEAFQGKRSQFRIKLASTQLGERELTTSYYPIEEPDGVRAVACVLRDITELSQLQLKQQTWQNQLELEQECGRRDTAWDWDFRAHNPASLDEASRQLNLINMALSNRMDEAIN